MRDPAGRVLALPNQTPGLTERLGLSRVQVDRAVWVITRDGRRYAAAEATNVILAELGGVWRLLSLLYALPLVGGFEEWFYEWFARNRGRFARWGVPPARERPRVPCDPA